MDELIKNAKIIIATGSGGVGKTTLSAAIAVRAAELGQKVLVLTIDPARRLMTALGIEGIDDDPILVPGQNFSGKLYAAQMNSKKVFDNIISGIAKNNEQVKKLFQNRLYQQLSTTLNGTQEFTSLEKLYQCHSSGEFDLIILDTPPAQHALDFLQAPQKFYNLFQESILKWFIYDSDSKPGNIFSNLFNKSTQIVISILQNLTGSTFVKELADLVRQLTSWIPILQGRTSAIQKLLSHPQTHFVLITGFDRAKLKEALFIRDELKKEGHRLSMVIANRVFPLWTHGKSQNLDSLRDLYSEMKKYYFERVEAIESFKNDIGSNIPLIRLPDFDYQIVNLDGLMKIASELTNRGKK